MKAVLQRVKQAEVKVAGESIARIEKGVLIFVGVEKGDGPKDVEECARKISLLRLFPSPDGGRMDLANFEVNGEYLIVSQFTLAADLTKGNRPSFDNAAPPQEAEGLYNFFVECMKKSSCRVCTGRFRAQMDVALINDGPVTFLL